jgi:thioredoxin reductase (NADPH)
VAGFPRLAEAYDFVIVGGGHAGLQAGLKAALLNHSAAIVDRGPKYSRSFYAPRMANIPGFPEGISGHKLLDAQIAAVRGVSAKTGYFTPALARSVRKVDGGFEVEFDWLKQPRTVRGRAVVLAMGVVDRIPVVGGQIDPIFPWANAAIVDFCVFCDGHDLSGKSVAVIGSDAFAVRTALDLRHFEPKSLELLTHGQPLLAGASPEEKAELSASLESAGISAFVPEMVGFEGMREKRFGVKFADGTYREYDRGFSGLGWYDLHGTIPRELGAAFDAEGFVKVDEDNRVLDPTGAPIPGLYCAGDLARGWNQIPEAWAQAERAVIHAYSYYL